MKKLYSFKMPREIEVEKQEKSTDSEGKEIAILRKVKEIVYDSYFVAKPTRTLKESAEIFYASIVSKCVSQGILTAGLTQKRVLNDGGILSEEQKKVYESLYSDLFSKQSIHKGLVSKLEPTEEEKEQTSKVFNEMVGIMGQIQNIEKQTSNNLYQNTAENIAQSRTNMWWTLNLSYKEENGKEIPMFPGKTYEEKLTYYDNLEENGNDDEIKLLSKLFLVTSLWYINGAREVEDFEVMIKLAENQNVLNNFASEEKVESPEKQQELKL